MLVECATTSTNNGSISINTSSGTLATTNTTVTSISSNTSRPTPLPFTTSAAMATTTAATVVVTSNNTTTTASHYSSINITTQLHHQQQDGLSSGSNSCSNSIGNSISTTSNSISNSNSIGTSWRVGNSSSSVGCNGRGSVDKISCTPPGNTELEDSIRGGSGEYSSTCASVVGCKSLHPVDSSGATTGYKYGSPLSDYYKYFNNKDVSSKTPSDNGNNSKMVDVEACLANTPPHLLIRSLSSLSHHSSQLSTLPRSPEQEQPGSQTLQKGVLQQARDRLFSRWKERYFVLTRDYLACFRRGSTKYSEMGSFIFKVNLASVEGVWWEERRGGPVVAVGLPREGRVLLRPRQHDEAQLQVWHRALLEATTASRLRRTALRRGTSTTHLHLSTTTPDTGSDNCCNAVPDEHNRSGGGCAPGSLDTDPPSTPPSSLSSSHKFSTTTSSGSGCGSSVASSPGLGNYNPPAGWSPRSRFSLVESPRRLLSSPAAGPPKTRHSLCIDPQEVPGGYRSVLRGGPRSPGGLLGTPTSLSSTPSGSRAGLALPSRRLTPSPGVHGRRSLCLDSLSASRTSLLSLTPRNPLLDLLENSPTPHSSTTLPPDQTPPSLANPRTRTSLTLFRNSPLFN